MLGMLLAEAAVFLQRDAVRVVLLILHCGIITLLAFTASESYVYAHEQSLL
jgi:hypothetical protein